jgi:hypothetical protein
MKMLSWTAGAALVALLVNGVSCSFKKEALLQPERLLGSTPERLIARLGQPKQHQEEHGAQFGFMRWPDIQGVHVLVIVKGGTGEYVSYQFRAMEPFDETKALALIGVELPEADPKPVPGSRAKRWQPFGKYEHMTINPDTRLISMGLNPSSLADPEEGKAEVPAAPEGEAP